MKYFWCLFVIALASQASAQLQCFVCENCETIPDNLVAQQCRTVLLPTTTLPVVSSTTLDPNQPELTPPPTSPPNLTSPPSGTTSIPANIIPTNPAPPALTSATPGPVVTTSTIPATLPTNPPPLFPTNAPIIVLPDLTPGPIPIPIPNPSFNPIPTTQDPFSPELTALPNVARNRRNVEVVPAASQFSCFVLQTRFNATTVITNRGCVQNGGDTAQTCQSANANIIQDSCSLCSNNECNSSTSLIASLSLIAAALLFAIKLY